MVEWLSQLGPVFGYSVPSWRVTWKVRSGCGALASSFFHSASVFTTLSTVTTPMLLPRSVKRWIVTLPGVTTMVSPTAAAAKREKKPIAATPPSAAVDSRNARRDALVPKELMIPSLSWSLRDELRRI